MRVLIRLVAAAAALALAVGVPAAARADEPGESGQARVLVLQAIALIVNTPDDAMVIDERIGDALEATDTEGVDLDLVRQAVDAVAGGNVRGARQLLQSAIGAGPVAGSAVPQPIRESSGKPGAPAYAVGAEPGTTVVLDEYRPGQGLNGGELVLLVLSVAAIAGGLLLAWRLRPADTVRQLRRADATVGEA